MQRTEANWSTHALSKEVVAVYLYLVVTSEKQGSGAARSYEVLEKIFALWTSYLGKERMMKEGRYIDDH